MANENESTIADAVGLSWPESPVKSPVEVRETFRLVNAKPLPCKPGDWLADNGQRVAKVKDVYWSEGEVLVDLVMHDFDGTKTGRESPAMGGPRTFEPACAFANWHRVAAPSFPITPRWVTRDGRTFLDRDAGPHLPNRQWLRPARKGRARPIADDRLLRALEEIAHGHNDARGLATEVIANFAAGKR